MAWTLQGNIKGPKGDAGTGGVSSQSIPRVLDGRNAIPLSNDFAGVELQPNNAGNVSFNLDPMNIATGSVGLIRNINGKVLTFANRAVAPAGRTWIAACATAASASTVPSLPSFATALATGVNGAIAGSYVTTGSEAAVLSALDSTVLFEISGGGGSGAAAIDTVAYTQTQTLTTPGASFTPNSLTTTANGELAALVVHAATPASSVSVLDLPAAPPGWTFGTYKRLRFREVIAVYTGGGGSAGPVTPPTLNVQSDGVDGSSLFVSAVMLAFNPAVSSMYPMSMTFGPGDLQQPGRGNIVPASTRTLSKLGALMSWRCDLDTIYLNGEFD